MTDDPSLAQWRVLTEEQPLIGVSARAADGVENVAVFRRADGRYNLIYSEGRVRPAQRAAGGLSEDSAWSARLEAPRGPSRSYALWQLSDARSGLAASPLPHHLSLFRWVHGVCTRG